MDIVDLTVPDYSTGSRKRPIPIDEGDDGEAHDKASRCPAPKRTRPEPIIDPQLLAQDIPFSKPSMAGFQIRLRSKAQKLNCRSDIPAACQGYRAPLVTGGSGSGGRGAPRPQGQNPPPVTAYHQAQPIPQAPSGLLHQGPGAAGPASVPGPAQTATLAPGSVLHTGPGNVKKAWSAERKRAFNEIQGRSLAHLPSAANSRFGDELSRNHTPKSVDPGRCPCPLTIEELLTVSDSYYDQCQ